MTIKPLFYIPMDNRTFKNAIFNENNDVPLDAKPDNNPNVKSDDNSDDSNPDDDLSDNENNNDPSDIIADDEQEIGDDCNNYDKDPFVGKIFNIFMTKYPHLDNFKNREIIYNICKIAVISIPGHDDPYYYINFIESSIDTITKNTKLM